MEEIKMKKSGVTTIGGKAMKFFADETTVHCPDPLPGGVTFVFYHYNPEKNGMAFSLPVFCPPGDYEEVIKVLKRYT